MSKSKSASLLPLPTFFAVNPPKHVDVIRRFLGTRLPHAPTTLDDALIIGLDAEWFERDDKAVTEVGWSVLDARSLSPNNDPWTAVQPMQTYHVRIKENAYMVNTELCPGRPDKFQFGETRFVTKEQARSILKDCFSRPSQDGRGFRPVIFLGHAVDNDIEVLKQLLGVDLGALGTIAMTIDTQVMAQEAGIASPTGGSLIRLAHLLGYFGIQEQFLHTAGNDAAYTMIAAVLTAHVAGSPVPIHDLENQGRVNALKTWSHDNSTVSFGLAIFCTRCAATDHFESQCPLSVTCTKCASKTTLRAYAHTHSTERCTIAMPMSPEPIVTRATGVVVPCHGCSVSPDPKRWRKAHTHVAEKCFFGNK